MRCLEKHPADRWQSAEDLRGQFEVMTTPSGGMTPTGTQPVTVSSAETRLHLNRPGRIAALYGLSSVGVLAVAYALMMLFGLPDWVVPMAGVLLLIGLPIVMVTSRAERHRATTQITGATQSGATPTPLQHRLTWRQSLAGGGLAFGALTVAAGGYMAMRALGIGPAGTLVSTGALVASDRLILAEFENRTSDSTLGETITQAMRIDLAQSPIISVLEPSQVASVLSRMRRDPDATVTPEVAREVAEREGIKAFITGDIAPVGEGFLFSAQIISTSTGDALASGRESANDATGIIPAVDRLSAHLRERIGESLRSVRADAPLADVTTNSIEALRLFALGRRAMMQNDFERAIALLEDAIAADSQFAMAYRDLGMRYLNINQGWRTDTLLTLGYQLRDRLSERERYLLVAAYERQVNDDIPASNSAYETLLEKYPDDIVANNNLAIGYTALGRWADGERVLARYVGTGQGAALHYRNLFNAQGNQGKYAEAAQTLDAYEEAFPGNSDIIVRRANLASAQWEYDRAEEYVNALKEAERGSARWQSTVAYYLRGLATVRGQLSGADRLLREAVRFDVERGAFSNLPPDAPDVSRDDLVDDRMTNNTLSQAAWFGVGDNLAGQIESWVRESPFPREDRSYLQAARFASWIGETELAKALLDEQKPIRDSILAAEDDEDNREGFLNFIRGVEVEIALAEGRPDEAIAYYREQRNDPDNSNCILCWMWALGNAHDAAGNADSTMAWFELHLATPSVGRRGFDAWEYPYILRRLGELYDERGERDKAADYYSRFVELWKDADPELQPTVQSARERLARLVGEANR